MNNKILGAIIIEGHVQGLSNTRSLGALGVPIYVIDKSNCIARYSKYCSRFFICPDFTSVEFVDFLIGLTNNEPIKDWLLLPSNDHVVYAISKHIKKLEKYFKFLIPPLDIIDNIYDKSKLLSIAYAINLPYPATQYFSNINDNINLGLHFPVLTKGRQGLTFYKIFGKKAFLAYNESELRGQLRNIAEKYEIKNTFTQELIPIYVGNKTISFTAFCVNGDIKTYWMGIKLREHPWQFGTATFAESINIPTCLEQSVTLLKALNYSGICEVEYLYDVRTKEYKLIEINARTWLWVGLAKACGVDYAKIIYDYVNNKSVNYPRSYLVGIKWINYMTDTYISISAIFRKQLSISEYCGSLKGKKIMAVFSWKDWKPAFMFLILAFSLAKKRNFLT